MKYALILFFGLLIMKSTNAQVCATREWHVHQSRSAKIDTTRIAGIANNFNFWPSGQVITVGFLNGTTEQKVAVLAFAKEWERYGNIRFVAADGMGAIVRIRFAGSPANFTYIGTDIKKVDAGECTMQIDQSLFATNRHQLRKVVLHQFGHVMGMVHEFNPPDGGVQWKKPHINKVYRQSGWNRMDLQQNMYGLYTHRLTNGWFFDHAGIMLLSLNGGVPEYTNSELSDGDKLWVESRYPFVNAPVNKRPPFIQSM